MGRGPANERSFELILIERGVSEKNVGWVLSKLDSQEYFLDKCQYMAKILSKESANKAKETFINHYFKINMKGISSENKHNDFFKDCIDKRKLWKLLEKNFGTICIKLPDSSVNGETYLFVCGPNKKCPEITNTDSFSFTFPNESKDQKKQNPLERSSLRLAG